MNLLAPYALWGLLGLAVPIVIHLLSKREHDVVLFGSLRFLQPMESDTAKSIRLSNYFLLLCRLMLLALICYLMARPFIYNDQASTTYWVEKGILENKDYEGILPDFTDDTVIEGFTFDKDNQGEAQYFNSAWSLISFLNQERDSAIVYSKSLLRYFQGRPVSLSDKVDWKILPIKGVSFDEHQKTEAKPTPWQISSDENRTEVALLDGQAGSDKLENVSIKLRLVEGSEDKRDRQLQELIDLSLESQPYEVEWVQLDADWDVAVGDLDNHRRGSIIWYPTDDQMAITQLGPDRYLIEGRLDRAEVLRTNVPIIITSILNKKLTEIERHDIRVFDPEGIVTMMAPEQVDDVDSRLDPYHSMWWLLLLPVFISERLLSRRSHT